MALSLRQYDAACKSYRLKWATYNEVLYEMCRKYPGHAKPGHINAKFGIIGRSFATGLERKMKSRGGQGTTLADVGAYVLKHRREVQSIFKGLARIEEPLTKPKLARVIAAHGRLTRLLRKMTRDGRQSLRSFVSKYMHFHCPAVPLYDTYAAAALRKLVPWRSIGEDFEGVRQADREYRRFCARFFRLYERILAERKAAKARLVDAYLLDL